MALFACHVLSKVNKVTIQNVYALPFILGLLQRLCGVKYFIKLDI